MWEKIIITLISAAVMALVSFVVAKASAWVNTKIKNSKLQSFLNAALNVVESTVKATYQTVVEGIKGTDEWTKEVQTKILQDAVETAKSQLSQEIKDGIEQTNGNLDDWLTTQIEAKIYTLKNTPQ